MPTPDTTDYEYRRPLETVQSALDDLRTQWYDLSEAAQTELAAILGNFRTRLYQAEGDAARGMAVPALLLALEDAPSLPASTAALLLAAHQPRRRSFLTLNSDQARGIKEMIDQWLGSDDDLQPSTAPAAGDEVLPNAPTLAANVINLLNSQWTELSLLGQEQIFFWLKDYYQALDRASDDAGRLRATHDFLAQIKSDPAIYALVETKFTHRTGRPSDGGMTAQEADRIREVIEGSPLMAIPKRPWGPDVHTSMMPTTAPPPPVEPVPPVQPATVEFHTDVRFPGQVSTFDRAIPLRVRLTLEKTEGTVVDADVSVEFMTPDPQPVLVVCNAEGFVEDTGDLTRTIMVYQHRDSQTAIFLLTPDADVGPGMRRISLDFYHRERLAGTARFQVDVRDRPPIDQTPVEPEPALVDRAEDGTILAQVGGTLLLASPDAAKPDFVLRITLSADRRRLSYSLHSPTGRLGIVYQRMGSVTLQSDPRTFLDNTLLRLSQMARASRKKLSEQQIKDAQQKLQEIGWDLYEQLFTPQLRLFYRELRRLHELKGQLSLLIVSDEPWIPWEMVLPHENDLPDEDFLCAQFRLTRWLEGRGLPEDFSLRQAQVVVPKSDLASVKVEQDFFSQQLPPTVSFSGHWLDTAGQVKAALRQGDSQWFHFACHGDFDYTRPDESALQLKGDSLTPSQIVGPMRTGLAISQPLVFLNACHTAEAGFSLTRMGGWAERFVRAGASAFVGSLWEVNDTLAAEFAVKFYTELLAGQTLGDAFHAARAHIRAEDPANPTWLAYTLYADPNGRVKPVNGDQ